MNTIYGKAAVEAAKQLQENENITPEVAWNNAVSKFTSATHSINKDCPKTTFLALCDLNGLHLNLLKTSIRKTKNHNYTAIMLNYISKKDGKIETKIELWNEVQKITEKKIKSNSPDTVVFSLYKMVI